MLGFALSALPSAGENRPAIPAAADPAATFIIGLSPYLEKSAKDPVFRRLVRLVLEDLPLHSQLEIYDAYHLKSITRIEIPAAAVFQSPKTRANQFGPAISQLKLFLALDQPRPDAGKTDLADAVRLPQFCDFLARNGSARAPADSPTLLLIGSPLYRDPREPAFSMVDGYYPSDAHLQAGREQSIYGYAAATNAPPGPQVYWSWPADPWLNDLHQEKVERFWALYLERRGGRLVSFTADPPTAFAAFRAGAAGTTAAARGWPAPAPAARLEMLRVHREMSRTDWLTGAAPESRPPPPTRLVGPVKIGIRWREDIDLDLYAAPRPEAETLFFQHSRSPEGYFYKDQRSAPGREFEYIEFESPVDLRQLQAEVNFYEGACPGGAHGEARVEFLNRIYQGNFTIPAATGNQGRTGPGQAGYWVRLPIPYLLGFGPVEPASP